MIPAVTVACRPNGEPIATAQSPTCTASELPILAAVQRVMRFDLDDRQVGVGVGADQLGVVLGGGAGQRDLDPVRLLDHVIVGENVAGRIDDHAGAKRCAAARPAVPRPRPPPNGLPKKRWKKSCMLSSPPVFVISGCLRAGGLPRGAA